MLQHDYYVLSTVRKDDLMYPFRMAREYKYRSPHVCMALELTIGARKTSVLCRHEVFIGFNVCHIRKREEEQLHLGFIKEKLLSFSWNCTWWLNSSPNFFLSCYEFLRVRISYHVKSLWILKLRFLTCGTKTSLTTAAQSTMLTRTLEVERSSFIGTGGHISQTLSP